MKKISFKIPLDVNGRWSLNQIYSGIHWTKRKTMAEEIHTLTILGLRKSKVRKEVFNMPVNIIIKYNSRLDIDNHGWLSKMITDGMKGYLIKDDTKKYVKSLKQEFYDEEGILVEVYAN